MASPKSKRGARPEVPVVRREPASRKRLPPELEAFARSEDMRLPRRPPAQTPRLNDPRTTALVPGVANRDARLVCDARVSELEKLLESRSTSDATKLEHAMAEAVALGVWRGRSVTAFEAFAVHVLRMGEDEAKAIAERGRVALAWPHGRASDACVAVWMRTEAALRESGFEGRASIRVDDKGREHVVVDVPLKHAPEGLDGIGRRMSSLVRDKAQKPPRAR